MKIYRLILLAIVLMLSFTGCDGNHKKSSSSTETVTKKKIVFSTNIYRKQLDQLVKDFESKNPDIKVEVEAVREPEKTFKARLAVNELPDVTIVAEMPNNPADYFISLDYLGNTNYDFIIPVETVLGQIYAIPIGTNYDGIIYSKLAFKDAGISKIPTSLEELYKVCERLKAKGITPLAISLRDKWPTKWYTTRYPVQKTGDPNYLLNLTNKDEFLTKDGALLNILLTLRDMNQKGYLEPDVTKSTFDQMVTDIVKGKTAMTFIGSWIIPQLIDNGAKMEDIGMFPFPETKCILLCDDYTYAISKDSKDIDAAKAFMKFAWEQSKISTAIGMASPFKNSKCDIETINELLSYHIPAEPLLFDSTSFCSMLESIGTNEDDMLRDFILTDNPDLLIKEYNEKWLSARKKLIDK
ncbi:MAG TPA: extracellular solute-binding protein [Clostridia bacterium]